MKDVFLFAACFVLQLGFSKPIGKDYETAVVSFGAGHSFALEVAEKRALGNVKN